MCYSNRDINNVGKLEKEAFSIKIHGDKTNVGLHRNVITSATTIGSPFISKLYVDREVDLLIEQSVE